MKNRYKILILLLLSAGFVFESCETFMDPSPDGNFSEEEVWSNPNYAEGVLMNAYADIPLFYSEFGSDFLDCATDNAVTNKYGASMVRMASGGWSSGSNPLDLWSESFSNIRYINLFLETGLELEYFDYDSARNATKVHRLKGEAYFLRAWYQWQLLQRHSGPDDNDQMLGFPVITEVTDYDEPLGLERNTYEESVEQIIMDCDTAFAYLPVEYTGDDLELGSNQIGRATATAAASLKSRVSLYAASPLFNSTNDEQKWIDAAQDAKALIDIIGNLDPLDESYFNDPDSDELIMRKFTKNRSAETQNLPPSYYGNGRTNPSQQLVDAFPMQNGYPIEDASSGYDPQTPYTDRDPRFYLSILYHGAEFNEDTLDITPGGKDSDALGVETATRTGYYMRKWMSTKVNLTPGELSSDDHYYALFRKVEAYLNYAEAANEAWGPGQDPLGLGLTAAQALGMVRSRAGLTQPDFYLGVISFTGKEAFRELVRNERRIELCFENHRFFDLRRWMVTLENLNEAVIGVSIEDHQDGTLTLTRDTVELRSYDEKMYYGPIPFNETVKAEGIRQNKGW